MTILIPVEPAAPALTPLAALAPLFEYPREDFAARIEAARARLSADPDAAERAAFDAFARAVSGLTPAEREELYTGTFEIAPSCIPYLSLHLFGEESFKRGAFMAALNARFQAFGFSAPGELPDHLAVILRFAGEAESPERRDLAEFCLLGPLQKMSAALADSHPYRALLLAAHAVLLGEFPGTVPAPAPVDRAESFSPGCGSATGPGCGCGPAAAPARTAGPPSDFGGWTEVDDD